ncbi:MAG TPA: MotA/TolQ/ExbB proton channel family protein [Gammaproteobacteria bacterium]|nr:MotA/TolQ/ExbB proton channel family protein [Gammaproteobacteria bacterium]HIL96706.1 MotA/TolQ/ExbB proton channel family protein [Pseudomonadales bacterium]
MTMPIRFFQDGGPFMIPIAIVLTFGVAIAIERYIFLSSAMRANRKDFDALLPLLSNGQYKELNKRMQKPKSAVSHVFKEGLVRLKSARRRQDIEYAMEEGLLEALPRIEKRTPYLATFANIATLLGLLGTIIGLIAAFTAVANADPAEKANLLSASISLAMNTTAFGLMVAIPLLLVHSHLQGKTNAIVESLDIAIVKFLNLADRQKEAAPK